MNKIVASAAEAIQLITSGASISVGGFGLCGVPTVLIDALLENGADELTVVSNNCGTVGWGLGKLLSARRIRRTTGSYVGENAELERQFLSGEVEMELVPQGTLAERLRAGGAGIPAFYTPAGVGTPFADGGLPLRYDASGGVAVASSPKEIREFDGKSYILEMGIKTDFALVRARYGDPQGNLVYEKSAQNFNPLCAAAGRVTIAEVEELVNLGDLNPMHVHTPGVFVQHVVHVINPAKHIEKITVSR